MFRIDIETCARCGGTFEIIASSEEPQKARRRQALAQHQPGARGIDAPRDGV